MVNQRGMKIVGHLPMMPVLKEKNTSVKTTKAKSWQ